MSEAANEILADLAVDYWKLLKAFERQVALTPMDRRHRVEAQLRFAAGRLERSLEQAGLTLATFEGQPVAANLPVTIVNSDELSNMTASAIVETIDPAILEGSRVVRMARAIGGSVDVSGN